MSAAKAFLGYCAFGLVILAGCSDDPPRIERFALTRVTSDDVAKLEWHTLNAETALLNGLEVPTNVQTVSAPVPEDRKFVLEVRNASGSAARELTVPKAPGTPRVATGVVRGISGFPLSGCNVSALSNPGVTTDEAGRFALAVNAAHQDLSVDCGTVAARTVWLDAPVDQELELYSFGDFNNTGSIQIPETMETLATHRSFAFSGGSGALVQRTTFPGASISLNVEWSGPSSVNGRVVFLDQIRGTGGRPTSYIGIGLYDPTTLTNGETVSATNLAETPLESQTVALAINNPWGVATIEAMLVLPDGVVMSPVAQWLSGGSEALAVVRNDGYSMLFGVTAITPEQAISRRILDLSELDTGTEATLVTPPSFITPTEGQVLTSSDEIAFSYGSEALFVLRIVGDNGSLDRIIVTRENSFTLGRLIDAGMPLMEGQSYTMFVHAFSVDPTLSPYECIAKLRSRLEGRSAPVRFAFKL